MGHHHKNTLRVSMKRSPLAMAAMLMRPATINVTSPKSAR